MGKDDMTMLALASNYLGRTGALSAPVLPSVVASRLHLLSYAVFAILLAIAGLVAAATLPILFGYHTYVVNGGSMEPGLKSGSVAVAKATSTFALGVGDVIARRQTEDACGLRGREHVLRAVREGVRAGMPTGSSGRGQSLCIVRHGFLLNVGVR